MSVVLSPRFIGALALLVAACGGEGPVSPAPPPPPPPPPPPAPVATIELSRMTDSLLAGQTRQLAATTKDAAGNTLNGRAVNWGTSNPAIATVSTAGLVTATASGAVTITASSEGKDATAAVTVFDPKVIPAFIKPFTEPADLWTTNYHDHDVPKEFIDNNGTYVPFWGEPSLLGIDGHEGYDWRLPVGTPLVAVAAGRVVHAGDNQPFACPILNNQIVVGRSVTLEHQLPGGIVVRTIYAHMEQVDVAVGGNVAQGQQIGTSGGRGCALKPHLHFAVWRMNGASASAIDSYGWSGPGQDPWETKPEGAASISLWKPGEAPSLLRRFELELPTTPGPFFQLTKVRFQGLRDADNPNNEFVEVTWDGRIAPASVDLSGATIRNAGGVVFTFPSGTTLSAANPSIRVFTGSGTSTPSTLFIGQATGIYGNLTDCVRVLNAAGQPRGQVGWGSPGCT